MNLERVSAIVLRQFYLVRGSSSRIVPLFAWVAVDIILWGFITKYLRSVTRDNVNLSASILTAVLLWDFFMRIMQGVTMTFFEDVWARNFLNYFSTALSVSEYLGGLVLSSFIMSLFGLSAMLFLATTFFGNSFFALGFLLVPYLIILILFGFSLGIIACAMVLRLGPASEWFVWPIPALIVPFAGVYYPVSVLPPWMQYISRALPPSYVFENLRLILMNQAASWTMLSIGMGLALFYILLAGWIFTRTFRYALRTGLIARYIAESVT
ncbi:MAG: ABC transporter permease [Bacteriovorax sp.]|nr:ABC transporter permease [Bacteriovorax sp.]